MFPSIIPTFCLHFHKRLKLASILSGLALLRIFWIPSATFSAKHKMSFPALKASHSSCPFVSYNLETLCMFKASEITKPSKPNCLRKSSSMMGFDKVAEVFFPWFKAGTAKWPIIMESTSFSIPLMKGNNSLAINSSKVSSKTGSPKCESTLVLP